MPEKEDAKKHNLLFVGGNVIDGTSPNKGMHYRVDAPCDHGRRKKVATNSNAIL
jgi:hypothetical protein